MASQGRINCHTNSIPLDEVEFHPHSFADADGRLFTHEGRLYRAINHSRAKFFSRLLNDGTIESLTKARLLISTQPTDLVLEGYGPVVLHERVPFVSYPNEWCAAMFKDAATRILELQIELVKRGLTLKDGHPWNLLFDAYKPVYVDLASIRPLKAEASWSAYDEYCRFCYYPLILMSHGRERIARCLLSEYEGVLRSDLRLVVRGLSRFLLAKLMKRAAKPLRVAFGKRLSGAAKHIHFLSGLMCDLQNLTVPFDERKPPGGGHDRDQALKQQALQNVLDDKGPESVLDIGSGSGAFSKQAARGGSKVVSFDADPLRIAQLYSAARKDDLPILPLVMDFIKPTPSVGYSSHYTIAATDRLKCDLAIAFSLVHKLVFERYLSFDLIAEGFSLFTKRWLVVEFVSRADEELKDSSGFSWYTLDNFIAALGRRFSAVTVLPYGADNRALLLCSK